MPWQKKENELVSIARYAHFRIALVDAQITSKLDISIYQRQFQSSYRWQYDKSCEFSMPLIPIPQSIVPRNCANKNNTVSRLNLKD